MRSQQRQGERKSTGAERRKGGLAGRVEEREESAESGKEHCVALVLLPEIQANFTSIASSGFMDLKSSRRKPVPFSGTALVGTWQKKLIHYLVLL